MEFECHQGDDVRRFTLHNVYYLPSCPTPLISIGRLRRKGLVFTNQENGHAELYDARDPQRRPILRVKQEQDVYPLMTWRPGHSVGPSAAASAHRPLTRMEAHVRLGHLAHSTIEAMVKNSAALHFDVDLTTPITECASCIRAKMRSSPIAKQRTDPHGKALGDRISADTWGPAPTEARGGFKYYTAFLDSHTDVAWLGLQRTKRAEEALANYQHVEAELKTQHGVSVKEFHSDRGGEFVNDAFDAHLSKQGTRRSLTAHDTPQHNGAVERLNGTVLGLTRAMLDDSGLPESFWGHAALYAIWLRNRTPTKKTAPRSPLEVATGERPDLRRARQFGCRVYVRVHDGSKLDDRGQEAVWVGPSAETEDGHKIYWPGKRTVTVERNVRFSDGAQFPLEQGESGTAPSDLIPTAGALDCAQPVKSSVPATSGDVREGDAEGEEEEHRGQAPPADASAQQFTAADIAPTDPDASQDADIGRPQRVRKPSSYIRAIQAGEGTTSHYPRRDPKFTRGLQLSEDGLAGFALGALPSTLIPRTVNQALRSEIWHAWEAAMEEEINSLIAHETFTIVPRNAAGDEPIIPLKWVFDNKTDGHGNIIQHKARIVARGDIQERVGGYGETYAPVLKSTSRNILLSLAAHFDWEVRQADFRGAYLNGVLEQPVYAEQPEGFDTETTPRETHILRLSKGLYGLKDAGYIWYTTLSTYLYSLGFVRSEADHAVFYRVTDTERTYIGLHVDDPMIVGNNLERILLLEKLLNDKYPMKVMGDISHFLGTTITRDRAARTICLSQPSYIEDVIQLCRLQDARPVPTALNPGVRLGRHQCPTTPEERAEMANVPFREALGQLLWIANSYRADIQYAASLLSQFQSNPGHAHWEALKHVVRYLIGTRDRTLVLGGTDEPLCGYSDASHGTESLDWYSMSGYTFTLFGGAISWRAKKQSVVAQSTAEAEYIALSFATREVLWIRAFLGEILDPLDAPTPMRVDNQSAISIAKTNKFHDRTKHIALPYHHVRHCVADGTITVRWISTHENIADIFTKPLDSSKTARFSSTLGLSA